MRYVFNLHPYSGRPVNTPQDPVELNPGSVFTARFNANNKGFGFLSPGDGKPDIFIPLDDRGMAQHGEIVQARLVNVRHDGRREGVVEKILSSPATWIGQVVHTQDLTYLLPQDPRYPCVLLPPGIQASPSDLVAVEISARAPRQTKEQFLENPLAAPKVEVLDVSTPSSQVQSVSRIQAALYGFRPHDEPTCALAQEVSANNSAPWKQEDLRHIPFVSIDGSSTKDFDDVVYAEKIPSGFRLWVGIADVAAYVSKGDLLDQSARARATSVYLPGLVMPMLPPQLSEGACSLRPNEDRSALVLSVDIAEDGTQSNPVFTAAVIRSHARLTYDGVSAWLEGDENRAPPQSTQKGVRLLSDLTSVLLSARARRGALDFNRPSYNLALNSQGEVRGIYSPGRTYAHRIVEECMVAANVAAANFLRLAGLPVLSRYHAAPHPDRLEVLFNRFPDIHGLPARQIVALVESNPSLLPFLRQAAGAAEYTSHNSGHFGLALEEYAHFTSPIRRYPDIMIHRAIHVALGNLPAEVLDEDWTALGQQTTERERAAAKAERASFDQLRIQWLAQQDHSIIHEGIIDGAAPAGVFLTLEETGASGLLRAPENSQYIASQKTWLLPDGSSWTLGDRLSVQISNVDVASRKISLSLAPPGPELTDTAPTSPAPRPPSLI